MGMEIKRFNPYTFSFKTQNMNYLLLLLIIGVILVVACNNPKTSSQNSEKQAIEEPLITSTHHDWSKSANIYEVNIRQYSEAGTFNAFAKDLPRLKSMGVDLLWLMPINPISMAKRKGALGSYYAVADYQKVNPEFGTMADFKALINSVHQLGMKIIIDWVPNHTGWDNPWITEHPDWFTQDKDGNVIDPINPETGESWGWTDVADLNYDNQEMRQAMIDAMLFWIEEVGIDGFRCDVAHQVPNDFWKTCIQTLRKANSNVYMLAEGEVPAQRNECGFDMDYAWRFKDVINAIGEGDTSVNIIDDYFKEDAQLFNKGYHMYFTTNHDENAWEGTVFERLGEGHKALAVLAFTIDGMPLIYSGQEAGMRKRLKFFEKDVIKWGTYELQDFYSTLLKLKRENQALWNGEYGGKAKRIPTREAQDAIYAYLREKADNKVLVILNLSDKGQQVSLVGDAHVGTYEEVFSGVSKTFEADDYLALEPWGYRVYTQ